MSAKVHPISKEGVKLTRFEISAPSIAVMDCGSWTCNQLKSYQYFGVVAGSYAVVGSFTDADGLPFMPAEITNKKLRTLFEQTNARVVSRCWTLVKPITAAEEDSADSLLSEEQEFYVFVPDCHLGLRDKADDFFFNGSRTDGRGADANLRKLSDFLKKAKDAGATVVQTGDFYDIWEAEAEKNIYYAELHDKPEIRSSDTPSPMNRLRDRTSRAQAAAAAIISTWSRDNLRLDLNTIRDSIDHYLPGNHDVEVRWLHGYDVQKRFNATPKLGTSLVISEGGTKLSKNASPVEHVLHKWWAEHGHAYDLYNDTSKVVEPEPLKKVLSLVPGKRITYAWARVERGQELAVVPITSVDKDVALSSRNISIVFRDPEDNAAFSERYLRSGGWGSSTFEQENFATMRWRIMERLLDDTQSINPGYVISKLFRWSAETFYCLWWAEGAGPPPRLPTRLVVHGHTHDRLLRRLLFLRSDTINVNETMVSSDGMKALLAR